MIYKCSELHKSTENIGEIACALTQATPAFGVGGGLLDLMSSAGLIPAMG
jgi:hypothetical protein